MNRLITLLRLCLLATLTGGILMQSAPAMASTMMTAADHSEMMMMAMPAQPMQHPGSDMASDDAFLKAMCQQDCLIAPALLPSGSDAPAIAVTWARPASAADTTGVSVTIPPDGPPPKA